MNNKDIEKNIRNAYQKIEPDQFESILSDCERMERETITMTNEKPRKIWIPALAGLGLAFALIISLLNDPAAKTINASQTLITIDVNPSIAITIDEQDKVLNVSALNDDGKLLIKDSDFKGNDLETAIDSLISLLSDQGYISSLNNSILISVDDSSDEHSAKLEKQLADKITKLISQSSIITQKVDGDTQIRKMALEYAISEGKAQLIRQLISQNEKYTYEQLAKLTINELNLLARNASFKRSGEPSDKAYIGSDKAAAIALNDLGISETDISFKNVEMDYEDGMMIYEVEFIYQDIEYEYGIGASDGEIIYIDKENERKQLNDSKRTAGELISEEKARQIALNNAGLSEDQITDYKIETDHDNGVIEYEIEFRAGNIEYEYDINALTGTIIKAESDKEDDKGSDDDLDNQSDKARELTAIALKQSGLNEKDIYDLETEKDGNVYEVSFKANGKEYEYRIDESGKIISEKIENDD